MELFSTIVQLRSRQNIRQYGFAGRQVQGWFLREVDRQDPGLADQLHPAQNDAREKTQQLRPYTLSTVYKGSQLPQELAQGDGCWVRITSLTGELSECLSDKILPNLQPIVRIGQVEFDVIPWMPATVADPRCGMESYASLMSQATKSKDTYVNFDFISPTTFKENANSRFEKEVPLPIPDRIFGNYMKHWSAFSGAALPSELGDFFEECLIINELKIKTERVQFSYSEPNRAATGFIGQARFKILGSKEKSRFGADWEHYANIFRVLASYSFYCGTGRHTTYGLGQTCLLPQVN